MNLICWNIRGLGSSYALSSLKWFLTKYSPKVIFISETKLNGHHKDDLFTFLDLANALFVDCPGKHGGLTLFWSLDAQVNVVSSS